MLQKKNKIAVTPEIIVGDVVKKQRNKIEMDVSPEEKEISLSDDKTTSMPPMPSLDRDRFIEVAEGLIISSKKINEGLSFMDSVLMDRDTFEESNLETQKAIHQAISKRYIDVMGSLQRLLDLVVKNDFNRNFLGVRQNSESEEEDVEVKGDLSKEAKIILARISGLISENIQKSGE